jgi:sugar phosphate isomerase/epimerase
MYFTGFADEAGSDLDTQIKATKELGWKFIETRKLFDSNLAGISEQQFEEVRQKLDPSGISFNCYGSGVANWAKPITEPPDSSCEEMKKAIPRMQALGIKMIRIMSFAVPKELRTKDFHDEIVKRLKIIVKMAEDAGIVCLHENCMNWGGLSYEHTLRLLDAINSPSFRLVFDTGNTVISDDVRGNPPYKKQNSLEFYKNVREFVDYIHIKDAVWKDGKEVFTFPGEGDGNVIEILTDLLQRGYDGGISIEPHMCVVFHEKQTKEQGEKKACENYIEYGRRTMKIVEEIIGAGIAN